MTRISPDARGWPHRRQTERGDSRPWVVTLSLPSLQLPSLALPCLVLFILALQGFAGEAALAAPPPPGGKTPPSTEGTPPAEGEVARLLEVLEQGTAPERRIVLLALAQQGDFTAVPTLSALLHDGDQVARRLAEQALWAIWSRSGDHLADSLLKRGEDMLAGGKYARALHVFDDVIAMQPEFAEGYNKRATAFYYLGRYQKSLDDIDETLTRNPYHFGALSGAGLCMLGLERPQDALDYFQRALGINPNLDGIGEMIRILEKKLKKSRI